MRKIKVARLLRARQSDRHSTLVLAAVCVVGFSMAALVAPPWRRGRPASVNLGRRVAVRSRSLSISLRLIPQECAAAGAPKASNRSVRRTNCVHKDHSLVARCTDGQLLGFLLRHSAQRQVPIVLEAQGARYSDLVLKQ